MTLTLPSFAKLNLVLEVLGKRPDGYHEIRTLLQTISLADELSFAEIEDGDIEIICSDGALPCDETNLAHRAAKALRDFTGIDKGVRIEIKKRIPVAGGLGGGSSNAAVTLIALQRLWGVRLATGDLLNIGSKLGADVPFFFMGGTCVGIGKGDEVYPLEDFESDFLLLVNAGIPLPTAQVYANLPARLTNPIATAKMPLSLEAAYANTRSGAPGLRLHNDLEISAFALHPLLAEIKKRLTDSGARDVLMSGSGSTVFAIFDSETARSSALNDLKTDQKDLKDQKDQDANGWWCAPARTLSRRQYQELIIDN